jgi:hypothetical protein
MTATINASTSAGVVTTADTSGILQLQTNGTAALTVDASQNVGIGTSSPGAKFDVRGGNTLVSAQYGVANIYSTDTFAINKGGSLSFGGKYATDGSFQTFAAIAGRKEDAGDGGWAGYLQFVTGTTPTERARIDSSGNLLVNTTTSFPGDGNTTTGFMIQASPGGKIFASVSAGNEAGSFNKNNDGTLIKMNRSGTQVGSISVTASATAYNTSSDYRLKNTIAPMTGALAKVALLKPVTYKWNVDNSDGQGFIAHELAEVVSGCVSGGKDAVETYTDEDGNEATRPVYQGIDTSFLVATLTAALQELKAIVDAQGAEIAALKGATA